MGMRDKKTITKICRNSKNMEPHDKNRLISKNFTPARWVSSQEHTQRRATTPFSTTIAILLVIVSACAPARAYNDGNYDPEQQDGIPVFSARSVPRPASSSLDDDWSNGGTGDSELMSVAPNQPRPAQRRQSDGDLDDGLEDEEEDEYKSGSSPHESIESPGYGESRRFAQDGDEIEEFFDRHLGPPKEAAATAESSPVGSSQYMVPVADPDDQYEAAASSPLSTIFHSLLGHHDHKHTKRPFLQIATSSASDSGDASLEATETGKTTNKGLKASPSAQSYTEATPIALALSPIAAPSTITVQEQQDSQEGASPDQVDPGNPSSGVREIYIGRRPTVMSYLQQAHVVQQQQAPLPGYYTAGSANVWRGPNGRPMVYEQEQSAGYARHPLAASYAYQREQPTGSSDGAHSAADDEQTVTYGLSFGGGGGDSKDDQPAADQEAESPNEETSAATGPSDAHQGYAPYNTKYTTSSTRAHNNYYGNQYRPAPGGYVGPFADPQYLHGQHYYPRQVMMVQQHQQPQHPNPRYQQQHAAGATRYHRDPSESANHLAAMRAAHIGLRYAASGQHRGLGDQNGPASEAYGERQRLLASLDREIKASPQYRQNNAAAATAPANSYARRPQGRHSGRQHMLAFKAVRRGYPGEDLDTFNSFHSEEDPYKTFTKTSRMISGVDPSAFLANTRQTAVQGESKSQKLADNEHGQDNLQLVTKPKPHLPTGGENTTSQSQYGSIDSNSLDTKVAHKNLLIGPLTNYDSRHTAGDSMRNIGQPTHGSEANKDDRGVSGSSKPNVNIGLSRVRRDDSEDREVDDDGDDDGVWVDDDGDDDNKQQSSDVNETSQEPEEDEEEDGQQDAANNVPLQQMNPPGVMGAPHSYELSPNDLMIYHG